MIVSIKNLSQNDNKIQDQLDSTEDRQKQFQMQPEAQKHNINQIVKNALKMAFGTMTSRVLGVLRESLLAALFDKSVTDAFNAAFRVPNLFRRLLGEGSLSVNFIPVFVDAKNDSPARAQNLVNSFYTILLLLLSFLTTLGVLFSSQILRLILDDSFIMQTQKMFLAEHMAKIMFLFIFFISTFAFFMGVLNSLGEFFWPAIAPTFWNVAMVISTIWPKAWLPETSAKYGDQLAWGVVIGGLLQVLVLVPSLIKKGLIPKPQFFKKEIYANKDTWKVFRAMGPGLLGMGVLQINTVINLHFSSQFVEGTMSYINYVDRLIELPLSLIAVSLGTAILPRLSELWSAGDKGQFAQTTQKSLELNLFLAILAACGLYVLANPIVDLLYGRGKFSNQDVLVTAQILQSYCWIMIFSSGVRVLTPSYFAIKNTWFPALISGLCVIVHFSLAPLFIKAFQVHGLLYSTILSAGLNFFLLISFYSYFTAPMKWFELIKKVLLYLVAGILMGLVASNYFWLRDFYGGSTFLHVGILGLVSALCLFTFFVLSYFLRIEEVLIILKNVRSRIRNKVSKNR